MWHNSGNERHLLASSEPLQSAARKDRTSVSQCAADWSCSSALHDEAQPLSALAGFMCLNVLLLLCSCCCHAPLINGSATSQPVSYHYGCSLWSIRHRWRNCSRRNYTFLNLYSICSFDGHHWPTESFWGSSWCGETKTRTRQRSKWVRGRAANRALTTRHMVDG